MARSHPSAYRVCGGSVGSPISLRSASKPSNLRSGEVSDHALSSPSVRFKNAIQLNNIDLEGAEIPVHIFTEHNGGELVLFMSSRCRWPGTKRCVPPLRALAGH